MADVRSLKSIWDATDSYYMTTVHRKSSMNEKNVRQYGTYSKQTNYESDSEDSDNLHTVITEPNVSRKDSHESQYKYGSETYRNFDALPEEFRPFKQGENLLKIRASPIKETARITKNGNENKNCATNPETEQFYVESTTSDKKKKVMNSKILPTTNNNSQQSYFYFKDQTFKSKEDPKIHFYTESDKVDRTEKIELKKSKRNFFYNNLPQKKSTSEAIRNNHKSLEKKKTFEAKVSEKSVTKSEIVEGNECEFFFSSNVRSKTTKINVNAPQQHFKRKDSFFKFSADFNHEKGNKINKQTNKPSSVEKSFQKVPVEKRMQWKNDLCESGQLVNKPQVMYKFTKVVSDSNAPLDIEYDAINDEIKPRHFNKGHFKYSKKQGHVSQNNCKAESAKPKIIIDGNGENASNGTKRKRKRKTVGGNQIIRHEIKDIHVDETNTATKEFSNSHRGKHSKILELKQNKQCKTEISGKMENLSLTPKNKNDVCSKNKTTSEASVLLPKYNRDLLIHYGQEISDTIVGSHVAMSTFLAIYNKWSELRRITMILFEELEKTLSQTCNRNKRVRDIAALLTAGVNILNAVPDPKVSIASKVTGLISGYVASLFSKSPKMTGMNLNDFQLRMNLQQDVEATTELYMYGLQCDQQFQETQKLIEGFHFVIQDNSFKEFIETSEGGFLKEILQFSPKAQNVYFKRFESCLRKQKNNQESDLSKTFCRCFEDWPDALEVISRLAVRFNIKDWNQSNVVTTWEVIYELLQDEDSLVKDVLKKVQDCILVLMKEQNIMEKYAIDLQKHT